MGGPSLFASRRCDVSTPWLQWSKQQPISKQHLALCVGEIFSSLSSPRQHDAVFTNVWNVLHLPCHAADWRGRSVLPCVRACSRWEHGDDETPHNQSLQVDKHPANEPRLILERADWWEGGWKKKVTEESVLVLVVFFWFLMARRGKCSHKSGFALKKHSNSSAVI